MAAEQQQCGADDLLLGQNSHFLMPACPPRVNALGRCSQKRPISRGSSLTVPAPQVEGLTVLKNLSQRSSRVDCDERGSRDLPLLTVIGEDSSLGRHHYTAYIAVVGGIVEPWSIPKHVNLYWCLRNNPSVPVIERLAFTVVSWLQRFKPPCASTASSSKSFIGNLYFHAPSSIGRVLLPLCAVGERVSKHRVTALARWGRLALPGWCCGVIRPCSCAS